MSGRTRYVGSQKHSLQANIVLAKIICPVRSYNVNCEDAEGFYPLNKNLYLTPTRTLSHDVLLASPSQVLTNLNPLKVDINKGKRWVGKETIINL